MSTTRFPMSLRRTAYVVLKLSRGWAQKRKTVIFRLKVHFTRRKSAIKFLCVKIVINKVVRHSLAYLYVQNGWWGTPPSTWKFGRNWPTRFKNADFQSVFARSPSAV